MKQNTTAGDVEGESDASGSLEWPDCSPGIETQNERLDAVATR